MEDQLYGPILQLDGNAKAVWAAVHGLGRVPPVRVGMRRELARSRGEVTSAHGRREENFARPQAAKCIFKQHELPEDEVQTGPP